MRPVIALGNRHAGDDAAGPLVGDVLRDAGCPVVETSDVAAIADAIAAADGAIVVDAASGPGTAGTVHRIDGSAVGPERRASSHGFGLREAIALARAQGAVPLVTVFAIVGGDFRVGAPVTPAVARAVRDIAEEIRRCA